MNRMRVRKVPECGYVPIGNGTYSLGAIVDVSNVNPAEIGDLMNRLVLGTTMMRIRKVPECGYVPIGNGTYSLGAIVDVSNVDPAEINNLLDAEDSYIEECTPSPA
jgi:hypothetical protein